MRIPETIGWDRSLDLINMLSLRCLPKKKELFWLSRSTFTVDSKRLKCTKVSNKNRWPSQGVVATPYMSSQERSSQCLWRHDMDAKSNILGTCGIVLGMGLSWVSTGHLSHWWTTTAWHSFRFLRCSRHFRSHLPFRVETMVIKMLLMHPWTYLHPWWTWAWASRGSELSTSHSNVSRLVCVRRLSKGFRPHV